MAITRRNFVKLAGIGVASLSLGSLLSACSSSKTLTEGVSVTGNTNEVVVSMTLILNLLLVLTRSFLGAVASMFTSHLFNLRLSLLMPILIS